MNTEPEEQKKTDVTILQTPTRHKRMAYKAVLESNIDTQPEHESQETLPETTVEPLEENKDDTVKETEIDENATETEEEK